MSEKLLNKVTDIDDITGTLGEILDSDTSNIPEEIVDLNSVLPSDFYEFIGMPQLQRREGAQTTQHEHPIVNNYADVYLVNDTLEYFDISYTYYYFRSNTCFKSL